MEIDIDKSKYLAITWLEKFLLFLKEDLDMSKNIPLESSVLDDIQEIDDKSSDDNLTISQDGSLEDIYSKQGFITSKLVNHLLPETLKCVLFYISTDNEEISTKIKNINKMLKELVISVVSDTDELNQILSCINTNNSSGSKQ